MFIKFCGMTREQDVEAAVGLGVDAVGLVFWPHSPRAVDFTRARQLIRVLPGIVTPVGVFVQPAIDDLHRAIDAGIRVAQVHGAASPLKSPAGCEQWFAATLTDDGITPAVGEQFTVLLDTHDPERHGGTGRPIDWVRAAHVAARRRVILAGGLTPGNVAAAIRTVRPFGVDVASGLEARPGVKDGEAMRAFVAAVHEADQ